MRRPSDSNIRNIAREQKSNHIAQNGLAFFGKPSIAVLTGGR